MYYSRNHDISKKFNSVPSPELVILLQLLFVHKLIVQIMTNDQISKYFIISSDNLLIVFFLPELVILVQLLFVHKLIVQIMTNDQISKYFIISSDNLFYHVSEGHHRSVFKNQIFLLHSLSAQTDKPYPMSNPSSYVFIQPRIHSPLVT